MQYSKDLMKYPLYYNPTAPGQYGSLVEIGKKSVGNKFKNSPAYKFSYMDPV
jgi:hypothetical protein